jgi:hypothetical protein
MVPIPELAGEATPLTMNEVRRGSDYCAEANRFLGRWNIVELSFGPEPVLRPAHALLSKPIRPVHYHASKSTRHDVTGNCV